MMRYALYAVLLVACGGGGGDDIGPSGAGISTMYPGDVGIGDDSRVIFADD